MNSIIDLLFGNPLLLFFVIAALLSFFQGLGGDKKGDSNRRTTPTNPNKEVRKQNEGEIDWREIFRQETSPFEERQSQPKQETTTVHPIEEMRSQVESYSSSMNTDEELNKANMHLQEKYEKLKERQKLAREKADKIENSPIIGGDISKRDPRKVKLDFRNISGDEAIKGLVWSEILNKPKSRSTK